MPYLPTFCPECNGLTMEVVDAGPDNLFEAKCTACGTRRFVRVKPEDLIPKGGVDPTSGDIN